MTQNADTYSYENDVKGPNWVHYHSVIDKKGLVGLLHEFSLFDYHDNHHPPRSPNQPPFRWPEPTTDAPVHTTK